MELSYQQWLGFATKRLEEVSSSPELDARLLLCHVLGISHTHLLAWPDKQLPNRYLEPLKELLEQRRDTKPVAYITGKVEFWGLSLAVNNAVLVPRPETETLVERCETILEFKPNAKILDMGTGSGAIALALASEFPTAKIKALDSSPEALACAKENARQLKLDSIHWLESNWFDAVKEKNFDIIVANPPYVAPDDEHLDALKYEPIEALVARDEGFADLEYLITTATEYLKPNGTLIVEHGFEQAEQVRQLFHKHGYANIDTDRDLAKQERCTYGVMAPDE